ncbi:MAG: sodium:proline symporter, partial [Corynebacterium sp.]|nr:sodium:proline symporter [Corynebacterium sp.]
MLVGFFGVTFLITLTIRERKENVDGFMVSSGAIGYGFSASSMTATWVWAASFYAAAEAGYIYGISGPIHYGLWGALMILCIYPFGMRFRKLAPHAHTLAELLHARHGSSSQMLLAVSNIAGSLISLTANFTAAGALIYVLTPFSFGTGVLITAVGVLGYTIWSGFRASVLTDFVQLLAMMGAAAIIIPAIFYAVGGPGMLDAGMEALRSQDPQKADFWSKDAFLNQGAPYMVAVLAYAVGNQTITQRLFAVKIEHIKSTFVTATLGYAGTVIGLGMIGVLAAMVGMDPADGNTNNLIPQMAVEYLPAALIVALFIMVIGSLASTADSDLSALASITMTDIYGKNIANGKVKPKTMLLVGRMTMIGATAAGVALAFANFNILDLLVFVGGLWGALVFPVIASFYWNRITSRAFVISVAVAVAFFLLTRFDLIPMFGVQAVIFELLAAIGAAVAVGLLAFGFLGRWAGGIAGTLMFVAMVPLFL